MSRSRTIRSESSPSGSKTESSTPPQSSAISEHSTIRGTPRAIAAWLEWSSEDRPASPSPLPARCLERMIRETSPKSFLKPFAWWSPNSSSWRTRQTSKALHTRPTGDGFSLAWPRSAILRNGIVFERATWAPRIGAIVSGSLLRFLNGRMAPTPIATGLDGGSNSRRAWKTRGGLLLPTPTAESYGTNRGGSAGRVGKKRPGLETMAKQGLIPTPVAEDGNRSGDTYGNGSLHLKGWAKERSLLGTPTATDFNSSELPAGGSKGYLKHQVHGPLSPSLHLWLMGWPEGASSCEPLGKESFRLWLLAHGIDSPAGGPSPKGTPDVL